MGGLEQVQDVLCSRTSIYRGAKKTNMLNSLTYAVGKVDVEIELQIIGCVKNCRGKYMLNSLTYSMNNKVTIIIITKKK
jgi:4-hydroxy-3-methylbut-2-en-1-yl diphosphate synthase IspG/GcpE